MKQDGLSHWTTFERTSLEVDTIYVIANRTIPRFAYTIGVSESAGSELIVAGAIFYMKDDVIRIINDIAEQLKAQHDRQVFEVSGQGSFTLRKVHASWTTEMILGAFNYYQKQDIPALQIVPDKAHWTNCQRSLRIDPIAIT